jgi:NhaA family Na+:H+ antiporter
MHASGVHATVAGVLLGFCVPAATLEDSRAERWAGTLQPWSSGIALPVFAFFSAGVTVVDIGAGALFSSPIAHGVAAGLLAGKIIGVLGTTAIVTRWTPLRLAQGIGLRDLLPVGFLTGIGFTVSLLIAELSFTDPAQLSAAKASVLGSSLIAAILGAVLLRFDLRKARSSDMNRDGIPDGQLPRIGDVATHVSGQMP